MKVLLKKINPDVLMHPGFLGMFFFMPLANSPVEICGVFVLAVWIVSGRFRTDISALSGSGIKVPLILLMALPWIGLAYTPSFQDGLRLATKTYYWFYALAIVSIIRMHKDKDLIIKMFLSGLSLNSSISILQFAGIIPLKHGSPSGLLGISSPWITYSLLLTTGILIASFYFRTAGTNKARILYLAAMLQYFAIIGFIGGRSGYVAFIMLSPLIIYNMLGKRHILKILVFSMLAVSLMFTSPVVKSRFAKAAEDIRLYRQGDIDTSLGLRFHMWGVAFTEIKKSPLIGMGTGGFKHSPGLQGNFKSIELIDHPHNSFLYMMVSYGLPGLIAFCWLLFIMLKKGWQTRNSALGFSVFAFTAVFIIGSFTDTQNLPFPTATALALFAGMSEAIDAG